MAFKQLGQPFVGKEIAVVLMPKSRGTSFRCSIAGVLGRFSTPAGRVAFFQTRARLARDDTSEAARLTSLLAPAREALDVTKMDFNQLLQRDLDDHRIAHELVPYILRKEASGPAFFPPILCAVLPFRERRPIEEIPELKVVEGFEDPEYPGATWKARLVNDVFRLQELCDENGRADQSGTAILRWNDENAKLVIMDGQHRAMALLAVHRTITNSWNAASSSSERYKPFYEAKIMRLWEQVKQDGREDDIRDLEFPVTICIFEEYTGSDRNPHVAARKLFIDVNKEARPPSESRLILLSDVRLDHVLAREILNRLRVGGPNGPMPLFAIEYDNPEPRSSRPRRWSAVTNLEILLKAVSMSCFGPVEFIEDVSKEVSLRGKPPYRRMDQYLRTQLKLQDDLPSIIEDGPREIERKEIGLWQFPIYNSKARGALVGKFMAQWGSHILYLLSNIAPYRSHVDALRELHDEWGPAGNIVSSLGFEALFEGVGLYWTLDQGHQHWEDQKRHARTLQNSPPPPSDITRAWDFIDTDKRDEFYRRRALKYLGSSTEEGIRAANLLYEATNTYAAQVGLVLAYATMLSKNTVANRELFTESFTAAINQTLQTGPVKSRDRRLILSKGVDKAFNQLGRMDTRYASYFRCFWLELLLHQSNRKMLTVAGLNYDAALAILDDARSAYFEKIRDDLASSIAQADRDLSQAECLERANRQSVKDLSDAYRWWFGIDAANAQTMVEGLISREEAEAEESSEADEEDDL